MTTALGTGLRRAAARLAPDLTPDGELLARFLADRDEAAFAVLVRRHARMVFGTCRRVLGNAADADDAFQAAFVVLVRKAHSLTDRACVGNFLYGVAFHTALKARAMATTRRAKEAKATRPEPAEGGELTRVLDEELAKLPDKYREPVVLCELEGVSRKDAASRLGVPEGTISSRLATAHRMLQKRLTARGFASVAVAAVLANQAFAVPETLAEAAVRAAADGPPAAVTQLASEVSKMLLWNKLKAGAAVLTGVLLLAGYGAMAPGFADDKPAVKAPVPKEAEKPEVEKAYSLKDDEVLKIIPAPFPDGRDGLIGALVWGESGGRDPNDKMTAADYHAVVATDGKTRQLLRGFGSRPADLAKNPEYRKLSLESFLRLATDLPPAAIWGLDTIDDQPELSRLRFNADVIVRDGTPMEKLIPALQAELEAKCGIAVTLTYTDAEREVVVVSGAVKPADGKATLSLDITAVNPLGTELKTVTSSTPAILSEQLALVVRRPVIDEAGLAKQVVATQVRVYERLPATADRDPAKVLKNLGEQTGLTFKLEKRKARSLLVAAKADAKKPEVDKAYSLKDGEVLKLIPAPYPEEREEVFKLADDRIPFKSADEVLMAVTVKDGKPTSVHPFTNRTSAGADAPGRPLAFMLRDGVRIDMAKVADPHWLLDSTAIDADVVLKKGAAPTDLVAALSKELEAKLGVKVALKFEETEREVVVISGKHTLTPLPQPTPEKMEFVHFYATDQVEHANSLIATSGSLPGELAKFVGRPVINESDLAKKAVLVKITYHVQQPETDKTRAADRDPAKVLKNLEEQTGLTFKLEKRKVRALVVSK